MDALTEQNLSKTDNFKKYHHVRSTLISGSLSDKKYKYSIVIPTYKRVDTLKDTIDSAVCQDYKNDYGIVVVDNNPERNDSTEIYIRTLDIPNLLYYKNAENIGMVANWNRCLELSNSTYVIMVHDDDILSPHFITTCEKILDSGLKVDLLFFQKVYWHQGKEEKPYFSREETSLKLYRMDYNDFLLKNDCPPTGMFVSRQKVLDIGGFEVETYPSADYYFNVKAVRFLRVYFIRKNLFIYRWGVNSTLRMPTLQGFVRQDITLKEWLMNRTGISPFLRIVLLKVYYYNSRKMMKKFCPEDYSKIDLADYLDFRNSTEKWFYVKIQSMIWQFIKWKRKKRGFEI